MSHASNSAAARRLGVQYPIIQGPFGGGLSTVQLTASVADLGGLGSFGAHQLPPDAIGTLVREIKAHTSRPFAVNLWVSNRDPGGDVRRTIPERRVAAGAGVAPLGAHWAGFAPSPD